MLKNGWRITEDEKHGVALLSPKGEKYRLKLEKIEMEGNK